MSSDLNACDSLRMAYLIPNDIMYVPFGTLLCEKALGTSHCIGLRAHVLLMSSQHLPQALLLEHALGKRSLGK